MMSKYAVYITSAAAGLTLAFLWYASSTLAQDGESFPPPPKVTISSLGITDALGGIELHLREQGVEEIRALIVADEQGRIFIFQAQERGGDFAVDASHVVVPVDLEGGRGAVTNNFVRYGYIFITNPVVAGGCGENHGGKRNCN